MSVRTLNSAGILGFSPPRAPWRRALALAGPGTLVAVGYMDPGNWAVDVAGGAAAGYRLLSVVLLASLAGMFVQDLVVRLTIATGRDLATLLREHLPRPVSLAVWLASEVAIVATELAELLGGAIAFKLLLGLPLGVGAAATAALTLVVMLGPVAAHGRLERIVAALVAVVVLGIAFELALVRPDLGAVLAGFAPDADIVRDPALLYLALGILGATVMPHNLYLHSGLLRDRLGAAGAPALDAPTFDAAARESKIALALAFLVNAGILMVAGAVLPGLATTDTGLEAVPDLLARHVGAGAAGLVFALALLAAGQSATITGALAGQLVMRGFLGLVWPAWLRLLLQRGAALALALGLLSAGPDGERLLVFSQVVLSLTLPTVLVPLAWLVSRRRVMGRFVIGAGRRAVAWALVAGLVGLNLALLPGAFGA
jgi:manganese transport protein